jgi:ubiquinone/menaquinone biosynthesis C-methylase UbiE
MNKYSLYSNDFIGTILQNYRVKTVLPYVKGRVLDIGCGDNLLCKSCSSFSVGIDIFNWKDVDLIADASKFLPFKNKTFDTITILAAFNHIPNRDLLLQECSRILKDEGRIVLTMLSPGISRLWHLLRKPWENDQKIRGMKEGEVFGFTKNDITNAFLKCNFKCITIQKFMANLNSLFVFTK